ncbi:hypothetical protein HGG78_08835 [Vibrio aestuarianus]|uniref:aspartate-alanine antiporter-like transporter n=1 Tax=Vibrio aestuarianus TaxID=28171 RepID=UPI001559ECBF|nr:NAD-binding protein [Vibrio aestuarianus]NGZ13845.1 hypothetical protein [Vibrio aestuarianus]NKZ49993.1 hypothetical protein [Vibrio aestuarianus]
MIENIAYFLDSQPFITLFLVIGIGYAVGKINVGGFSLGIGAVLFVGLAFGAIAPNATPPGLLGLMGLVLFLYGIGIQYGQHFFSGLASSFGIKVNLLAAIAVLAGFGTAVLLSQTMHFSTDFAAGMFAGSLTSTASLQAAFDNDYESVKRGKALGLNAHYGDILKRSIQDKAQLSEAKAAFITVTSPNVLKNMALRLTKYQNLDIYARTNTREDEVFLKNNGVKYAGSIYVESTLQRGRELLNNFGFSEQDSTTLIDAIKDEMNKNGCERIKQ